MISEYFFDFLDVCGSEMWISLKIGFLIQKWPWEPQKLDDDGNFCKHDFSFPFHHSLQNLSHEWPLVLKLECPKGNHHVFFVKSWFVLSVESLRKFSNFPENPQSKFLRGDISAKNYYFSLWFFFLLDLI